MPRASRLWPDDSYDGDGFLRFGAPYLQVRRQLDANFDRCNPTLRVHRDELRRPRQRASRRLVLSELVPEPGGWRGGEDSHDARHVELLIGRAVLLEKSVDVRLH